MKETVVFSGILIGEGQRVECKVRATKSTLDGDPSVSPAFSDYSIVDSATSKLPDGNYDVFAHGRRIGVRRQVLPPFMNATRAETRRASDRITLRMPVEASWVDNGGMVRRLAAQTLLVSRNGGVLRLPEMLAAGQELTLKRQLERDSVKTTRVRVVAEIDREPEAFLYAVHILESHVDFWDISPRS